MPVLVCDIEDEAHQLTQLTENIQRQDLTLTEEAAAVRQLKDAGKSVTDIAAMMHKSKSWVSKRLAASNPELAGPAARLIENHITEDLELILAINEACKLDFYEGKKLANQVKNGTAGRETVREGLAQIKSQAKTQQEAYRTGFADFAGEGGKGNRENDGADLACGRGFACETF